MTSCSDSRKDKRQGRDGGKGEEEGCAYVRKITRTVQSWSGTQNTRVSYAAGLLYVHYDLTYQGR
ncbi:hypothetical protein E2C01_059057 [Portunus trituberculatus]|uniref:Uncharacterized protein n=1 Tax=Portunus trituberculatus TaxID=210409 RepID=A0A5B7H5T2_PORTR|nr:hypothetical protein [Portunus trituberculatus]